MFPKGQELSVLLTQMRAPAEDKEGALRSWDKLAGDCRSSTARDVSHRIFEGQTARALPTVSSYGALWRRVRSVCHILLVR